ncbi:MAG: M23 family metallopeptidase, partial [Deltaproteobacteria bacterium]|nr:M23 family metallopeptidase [Deltaproteobacteria bacterium]
YVVSVGDAVKRGDHIGHVGRTGRATGYHLHFEIIDEGRNLDPAQHVWLGSELVLGPTDLDPETVPRTSVAEPGRYTPSRMY